MIEVLLRRLDRQNVDVMSLVSATKGPAIANRMWKPSETAICSRAAKRSLINFVRLSYLTVHHLGRGVEG